VQFDEMRDEMRDEMDAEMDAEIMDAEIRVEIRAPRACGCGQSAKLPSFTAPCGAQRLQ
jgi:hypothetical protein